VTDARGVFNAEGRINDCFLELRREQQNAVVQADQTGNVFVTISKRLIAMMFASGLPAVADPRLKSICVFKRSLTPCI
jgi:hypothetical protein